jgi:hypothetical protein
VSSDQDQEQFKGYYSEMPWLALEFENRELTVIFLFLFKLI